VIPDEEVERVLDAADVVAIVGERIKLKRVGNSWRGPCPFHHGKGDNFSVMPGRGYRCWVCGETGSVFTFVQKQMGLDFVEAVKFVGHKSGVEVREVTRRTEGPDPREPLWEIAAAAAEFFRTTLWDTADGERARTYLETRGITRDVAERFLLGYSPVAPNALQSHLETLGYSVERQTQAGLLKSGEEGGVRPRFRGRVMFPIHDGRGHTVGFGGRSIDGREPKYINSAESAIYSKGTLLYHLHEARHSIRKADRVVLVEGYFDVIRTVAAGVEEVVAPLGTALTGDQAKLLRRYTPNVFLLYDSDKAGLKATFRSGDALLAEGASVRVVTLPDGEDPDTYVAKFGAAALEKELRAAVDVFERMLQILQRGGWFADLRKSRQAIDKLLPTIRAASDPVTRDLYLTRAAQASGVDRATLAREVSAAPRETVVVTSKPAGAPSRRFSPPRVVRPRGLQAEMALLRAMIAAPDRTELITEQLSGIDEEAESAGHDGPATLRDSRLQAIHQALLENPGPPNVTVLTEHLLPDAVAMLESLMADAQGIVNLDATIADSLNVLRARWRQERIQVLRNAEAGRGEDAQPDIDRVQAEIHRLKLEIQALTRRQ
jgi:DNA primase